MLLFTGTCFLSDLNNEEAISVKKTAVFLIDVQRDFCEGGALAVPNGDEVVPVCNELIKQASEYGCAVLASRDRHPADHCSFSINGGQWPVHCVDGQPGAEFHKDLQLPVDVMVFDKGTHADTEAYSAFDGTAAASILKDAQVARLIMCGLATDYCVKASVLDALKAGFEVTVISDGCRAVNVNPDDGQKAFEEMKSAGAEICTLSDLEFE